MRLALKQNKGGPVATEAFVGISQDHVVPPVSSLQQANPVPSSYQTKTSYQGVPQPADMRYGSGSVGVGYQNHATLSMSHREDPLNRSFATTGPLSHVTNHSQMDQMSAGKPKLPHGLTVHELKAMTHARLHAESTDKRELNSPETLLPSTARESVEYRDAHAPSPTMSSPTPSYGRPTYQDSSLIQHESWSHDSRNETWDNGSVSTQTSDFIGSDHVYAPSFNGDDGSVRNLSFQELPRDTSPAFGQSQSPYFDSSFAPNRRRAATLSPRVGLSHLHEDRPVLPGQESPGLPSFRSRALSPANLAPRATVGAFVPHHEHQSNQAVLSRGIDNRLRTSSTTSLPPYSNTADEFALETGLPTCLNGFSSLPEERPGSNVTGLSDVFRGTPQAQVAPPPGMTDLCHRGIGSLDTFAEQPRDRASTWGAQDLRLASTWADPSSSSASNVFGPGVIGGQSQQQANGDSLAGDLASILKLSGATEGSSLQRLQ